MRRDLASSELCLPRFLGGDVAVTIGVLVGRVNAEAGGGRDRGLRRVLRWRHCCPGRVERRHLSEVGCCARDTPSVVLALGSAAGCWAQRLKVKRGLVTVDVPRAVKQKGVSI